MLNRRSFLALVAACAELQGHAEQLRQLHEPDDLRRRLLEQREALLQLRAETIAHQQRHREIALSFKRLTVKECLPAPMVTRWLDAVDPVDGIA
jgi:hypothetical protein